MAHTCFFQCGTYVLILTFICYFTCSCVSCSKDGNRHGLLITDQSDESFPSDERFYRVLEVPENCKHKPLTKCHINPDDHSNYQLYCFDNVCDRNEMYFCLNGIRNTTIHACGPTKRCKKRHKNVFKHEKHGKGDILKVYSIACKAGYFQPAYFQKDKWNCFTNCEKDESVVIIQNATDDKPVIGRCNSHKNYCNGHNVSLFELGSSDDHCLHAKRDLNLECNKEEELLPNCTCAIKCISGTIRDWNDSLNCIYDNNTQSTPNIGITKFKSETTTTSSHQSASTTSQENKDGTEVNDTNNKVLTNLEEEQEKDNIRTHHTEATVRVELIAVIIVVGIPLISFATGVCIWMIRKKETYASFDTEMKEKEHLLMRTTQHKTGEDTHVRDFKKLYNDTNTQAEISCLNNLMQSCGAILHRHKVIGSAFLAGQKHVITAFHVIREIVRDNTGESDYNFALIETKEISINFNGSVLNRQKRDIFLKYRYHNETYDIAVLEIKDLHLHKELPDPLMLWQYNISFINQNQVILIGYGNASKPNDKCKETCELIGENDFSSRHRAALASLQRNKQQYKNAIPGNDKSSIEYGYSGVDNEAFIKFDCIMEKGLSGGPVILLDGGHSPKVIGIVKGGMPDFYYDLPPEIQTSFEKKHLFEVGVKMQMIYETMKREDPGLASELFPENRE